jgi:hypothetical protein
MSPHFTLTETRRIADEALLRASKAGGGGGGITQLLGDVLAGPGSGAVTATVVRVNGATVPAAGALTPGNLLQVSGAAALVYAALNLANPASVSGVLGIANGGTGLSAVGANGNLLQVSGGALAYGPVNLANASSVTGQLSVANIEPGANTQVLTTTGGVATWAAPAPSGITQLTQDVHAGPGTGSQAATVVQAQDGAVLFDVNGTVHGYLNSGTPNVGWSLGRDPTSLTAVALFINSNLGAGGDAFASAVFQSNFTTLNCPAFGSELDLAVGMTPYVQLRTTELAIPDQGTLAAVTFFESIATVAYPFRRIISIFNATSDILPNSFTAGSVFLYTRTNTNGLAQGLVALGGGGAIQSMAPNGTGTINSQAMLKSRERFAGRVLLPGTPTATATFNVPPGVFSIRLSLIARLVTPGAGGGTAGDGLVTSYQVGGKNVGGTVSNGGLMDSQTLLNDTATFVGFGIPTLTNLAGAIEFSASFAGIATGNGAVIDTQIDFECFVD